MKSQSLERGSERSNQKAIRPIPIASLVTTICDLDREHGEAIAKQASGVHTSDLMQVLASDVVINDICLTPHLH